MTLGRVLDRHVDAFGGVAAQRLLLLPGLVVAGELLLNLGQCPLQGDFPAPEALLPGQPKPEFGTGCPGHRRPYPSVEELFEDRMHMCPPLMVLLAERVDRGACRFNTNRRVQNRQLHASFPVRSQALAAMI